MKTNQVMIRLKEAFLQRTKDGYFNATQLLAYWNDNNEKQKQLNNYYKNVETKNFIEQLQKEGIEKPLISKMGRYESGTWMHPKLFIDFAMWISVEFKSIVIDYVLDGLIKSRHDAGDYYNEMTAVILEKYIEYNGCKPSPLLYAKEANMIKDIAGLNIPRNEMTEEQLKRITMLQKINAQMIRERIGVEKRKKQLEFFNKCM